MRLPRGIIQGGGRVRVGRELASSAAAPLRALCGLVLVSGDVLLSPLLKRVLLVAGAVGLRRGRKELFSEDDVLGVVGIEGADGIFEGFLLDDAVGGGKPHDGS